MGLLFSDMTITVELVHMTCGECGSHFAIDQIKYDRCKKTGEGWHCPNGHSRKFTTTENSELKDRITQLQNDNTYLRHAKDNLHTELTQQKHVTRTYKGQVTKIKKRVHNGVCPCCNRTFTDLQRHMSTKHPDFVKVNA